MENETGYDHVHDVRQEWQPALNARKSVMLMSKMNHAFSINQNDFEFNERTAQRTHTGLGKEAAQQPQGLGD